LLLCRDGYRSAILASEDTLEILLDKIATMPDELLTIERALERMQREAVELSKHATVRNEKCSDPGDGFTPTNLSCTRGAADVKSAAEALAVPVRTKKAP
jgi:hypothetical protein